jgi:hypothetical protein
MRPQFFFLHVVLPALAAAATLAVPTTALASTLAAARRSTALAGAR